MNSSNKLQNYYYYYNSLVEALIKYEIVDIELHIKKIELVAWFGWYFHPAYFADARLEKNIFYLSKRLFSENIIKKNMKNGAMKRTVLHVATAVYPTGGHTRLIANIVTRDLDSCHSLVLSRQDGQLVPGWLEQAIISSEGQVYDVQKKAAQNSIIDSVRYIRNIAADYDYIFLHVHPNDTTAFLALAYGFEIPVAFVNHADHVFNLGTSLVDTVVCTREWSESLAIERRLAERVNILPLPLNFKPYSLNEKREAKSRLNLSENDILILSVASYYKFIPDSKYNFMSLAKKIVNQHNNVRIKIIGVRTDEATQVGYIADDRIELLGLVENLRDFYLAADIYLDSMPFSSFTALWEAIYFKAFPILQFAPSAKQVHDDELAIQGIIKHSSNEQELLHEVDEAIANINNDSKILNKLSDNINYYYAGAGWNLFLEKLYLSLNSHKHDSYDFIKNNGPEFMGDDIDAAEMPTPFNSADTENYFVDLLYQNLNIISISELFALRKAIIKSSNSNIIASTKTFVGLLKTKTMQL